MRKNARQTAEWFQARLDALEISQGQLAERSGIDASDWSRYKSGKQRPRIDQIERLAASLEVDVLELLIGLGAIDPDAATTPKVTKGKRVSKVDWS